MGNWKILVPSASAATNLCTNPSVETNLTNWSTGNPGGIIRSNEQSWLGAYSCKFTLSAGSFVGCDIAVILPTATTRYVASTWIYVPSTTDPNDNIELYMANYTGISYVSWKHWIYGTDPYDKWFRIHTIFDIAVDLVGSVLVRPQALFTGSRNFYIDAVMVEQTNAISNYIDGDQPGCAWTGTPHASTSSSSAISRATGVVKDLKDDYYFGVSDAIGVGAAPLSLGLSSYAFLPGGEVSGIKRASRKFSLVGTIKGSDADCDLHSARQALIKELAYDRYPQDENGWQPIRLRYTGADVTKEISAFYTEGLSGSLKVENRIHEKLALQFTAPDPMWYGLGENAEALDENDSATFRYVAGRLISSGKWDNLGLTANPTTNGAIYAIAVHPDSTVYVGGDFTGMDNQAGRDYVAAYHPASGTWSTIGAGSSVNGIVRAIAIAPNGDVYIGGDFTNVGDANGDYVAYWDGANWNSVSGGGTAAVRALLFGQDGTLYIGGYFANWNAIAAADNIVSWNGTAYAALDTGTVGNVMALATSSSGDIYAGEITSGGIARVEKWDGSAWTALGTGMTYPSHPADNMIVALAFASDGTLYAAGQFETAGGTSAKFIAKWNGIEWSGVGGGASSMIASLAIAPDGLLYAGGLYTNIGGISVGDRIAAWDGSAWRHLDVDLPGAPYVWAIAIGSPNVVGDYDTWIGFTTTGTGYASGISTITNNGSMIAYPRIVIERSGGTSATLSIVRNNTSKKELLFDYSLLDGETLTIDLRPAKKSIVSSFFGNRMDAILANSDFGTFTLLPGDNKISCFVAEAGAPTVNATILWQDTYDGLD